MLVEFCKTICGTVRFEASNGFCERLINLCASNNITLSNLTRTDEGFIASVASFDFKTVKALANRVNIDICVQKKQGVWFKIRRYSGRWGIAAGAAFFLISIILSSGYIWEISVSGNKKVAESAIIHELKSLGLDVGSKVKDLDLVSLKQQALLKIPELAWLTLNRHGSKIDVIVSERYAAPSVNSLTPCDIVATRTGQIKYMRVYAGTAVVKEGFPVKAGDLLISGKTTPVAELAENTHADAKIIAQIQFDKTLSVNLEHYSKKYNGKVKTRYFLGKGDHKFPLFLATKQKGDYDVATLTKPIRIFSIRLPIMFTKHTYRYYDKVGDKLTIEAAKDVLDNAFVSYENLELRNSAIIARTRRENLKGDTLSITISYTVEENIAKKVPISTQ